MLSIWWDVKGVNYWMLLPEKKTKLNRPRMTPGKLRGYFSYES